MSELITPSNYQDFTLATLQTPDGITKLNSILSQLSQNISSDSESVRIYQGVGTPEASVAAGVGSIYMRTDGGADTSVYRKESGSADTGWVAIKAPASLPLSTTNGGTGADNSAVAQGYILYFSATGVISVLAVGTSGQFLKTQGASANPIWAIATGLSNVVFCFSGSNPAGSGSGFMTNASLTPSGPTTRTYSYWFAGNNGSTIISSKFIKISGINTATIYALTWTSNGADTGHIVVNVGGQSNSANFTTSTPTWINFTIDVSSLTNGTAYDISISLINNTQDLNVFLGSIIGFGS